MDKDERIEQHPEMKKAAEAAKAKRPRRRTTKGKSKSGPDRDLVPMVGYSDTAYEAQFIGVVHGTNNMQVAIHIMPLDAKSKEEDVLHIPLPGKPMIVNKNMIRLLPEERYKDEEKLAALKTLLYGKKPPAAD